MNKEEEKTATETISIIVENIYDIFKSLMKNEDDVYDLKGIRNVLDMFLATCEKIEDIILEDFV